MLRRGPIRVLWATVLTLGRIGVSSAQESEAPIRVEYMSPSAAGCPTEDAFFEQVRARTPRIRRAAPGERARTFEVSLTSRDRESRGRLIVRDPGEKQEADRDIVGDTCEEVVAALALITALTVDPGASTNPIAHPRIPPAATPAADTDGGAPTPPEAASQPAQPPQEPRISARPRPEERPPTPSAHPWSFALTANAGTVSGISPRLVVGFPVFIEASGPRTGFLAPTLRAGFERASSGTIDVQGPTATLTWTVGIVDGCPTRWTYGTLTVQPCVRAEAGVLQGAGGNIVPAREDTRPWLALGAMGRAQWFAFDPLFLDFEAGLRFPFIRTRYYFVPDMTIYEPAAVGWVASAGLGVRFL